MTGADASARIAITGGFGFLGWHLACRLLAITGTEPLRLGRRDFADIERLAEVLADVDCIYHLAGTNRADVETEVEAGNWDAAQTLASAVRLIGRPVKIVYTDSVHRWRDTGYGRGKFRAGELLSDVTGELGGSTATVVLPNVFGEHGRPFYNSFVATFCHQVAAGRRPTVERDDQIPLIHAQDAAEALIRCADSASNSLVEVTGDLHSVSEVLALIDQHHHLYTCGEIPDISRPFDRDIFNTYRSFAFERRTLRAVQGHGDDRGDLFEAVRSHGGRGQVFVSSTFPGQTRGNHFHLRKVERFVVIRGQAEIALRRLYHDTVVRVRVSGESPALVDMPTMWVHNITNVGTDDLITAFWSDQLLDQVNPDQYPQGVDI